MQNDNLARQINFNNKNINSRLIHELERESLRNKFKILSSSPQKRLLCRLEILNKAVFSLACLGFFSSALSYFALSQLESSLHKNFVKFNQALNEKQETETFLSEKYSWKNLDRVKNNLGLQDAKKVYFN